LYRIATIFFVPLRYLLFMGLIGTSDDEELKKSVRYVLSKSYLGDWFVLYQLGRNVNHYFMREFMKELKKDMSAKPKRSRSLGKGDATASAASTMPRNHKFPNAKRGTEKESLIAGANSQLDANWTGPPPSSPPKSPKP